MDVSQLFETEFQLAIEKVKEYTPDQLIANEELRQIKISSEQFSDFCSNLIVPNRKKAIDSLVDSFNRGIYALDDKHAFLVTNGDSVSQRIRLKASMHENASQSKELEVLKSVRKKYINDLKYLEYLQASFENVRDKIEAKLASIQTSTIYKWEFRDHAYITGLTIINTFYDELIDAGLIHSHHQNSSKENFKLLFQTKTINPHLSAQPIVWMGTYPQLYYLIKRLTKKVIKLKKSKPSHIDVIFHVFREMSEDSPFQIKNRRNNDIPANQLLLDKIIANVESKLYVKK